MSAYGGGFGDEAALGGRVYCLVPHALADRLYEPLRRHFAAHDPAVTVIVEKRWRTNGENRRSGVERRVATVAPKVERRRINSESGRRIAERRAPISLVAAPVELPRRARRHADEIAFFERQEPAPEQVEQAETKRLITRVQAGEVESFAKLYHLYFDRLYSYIQVTVRDRHEAEDLAQEVFTDLFDQIGRYRITNRPFSAFAYTIARNHAVSYLRKHGRLDIQDPAEMEQAGTHPEVSIAELGALAWVTNKDLYTLLEPLPLVQRQVIFLQFKAGLTPTETAEVLGRSYKSVQHHKARALAFLLDRLQSLSREPKRHERQVGTRRRGVKPRVLHARRFGLISPGPTG